MSESFFHSGEDIGGFTVLHPCGAGAFGQVYLVRDANGRTRALKVLSADKRGERELDGLLRFQRAAHPNLLHIDRLSSLPDGRVFYTMDAADNAVSAPDYVPDTLARRLRERGALPPDELKRIMLELVSAVAELHRTHLLHRDIKPENILFVNGRATLADAGAVGEVGGTTFIGTPEYLPPEVCTQKRAFTAADDCYALGMVLYSALTGEAPRKFPSTPRTLDREAAALFKTAERACTPPGVSAYRFRELLEHPETSSRRSRRSAFILAAVAVCLVLAGGAAALTLRKKTPPPPAAPDAPPQTATPVTAAPVEPVEPVSPAPAPRTPVAVPKPKPEPPPAKPADRSDRRSKEERNLDGSIRIRLEGAKMNLAAAENTRRAFLAKDLDLPEQQKRVDELRAERDELEAMLKLPLEEKRRAFDEYKKRKAARR